MPSDRVRQNEFKKAVEAVLCDGEAGTISGSLNATYANGVDGEVLEHSTRRNFLDEILRGLGWTLSSNGDMLEEARVRGTSVKFMDYLGISEDSRRPVLVFEAKAWGVPFIKSKDNPDGRRPRRWQAAMSDTDAQLTISAIRHIQCGGSADTSPVLQEWHKYLDQISGYVRDLWANHKHVVSRAALSSGEWLMVFVDPNGTFNGPISDDPDQIAIFHLSEYLERSNEILALLGRQELGGALPPFLSVGQLGGYVSQGHVARIFHALRVRYETSGFSYAVQRPRILVQPVVTIERDDGIFLNVVPDDEGFLLDNRPEQLNAHLFEVKTSATALLGQCSEEIGEMLDASSLEHFPGFAFAAAPGTSKTIVRGFSRGDEWLYVTGTATHFLLATNTCVGCKFHTWSACNHIGVAFGIAAVTTKSVSNPRNFFVDGEMSHCAHSLVIQRRAKRCVIDLFETRACCQSCAFVEHCWSEDEVQCLPCET